MRYLSGLQEYPDEGYNIPIFDWALALGHPWELHIHNHSTIKAKFIENLRYDVKMSINGTSSDEVLPKIDVKLIYREDLGGSVTPVIKTDNKAKDLGF